MSEHPNVYDMAYGVCIIIFPNPTMMATGQCDFYICYAVVLLSRIRILGLSRFDSKAELLQLNRTQFPSLRIFVSKKVGN
jgi:hypothetical protein